MVSCSPRLRIRFTVESGLGARHRAYWATQQLNMESKVASEKHILKLSELEEFCKEAYENAKIYKEKTKLGMINIL